MSTTTPTGRVLSYREGQALVPAIGQTVDTTQAPWAAAGIAANLAPGLYRVTRHVISAEPHRTTGKVSPNAGKVTVRVAPALSPAEAREALARAEAGVVAAQARVAEAREALAEAEARAALAPAAPAPAPAADPLAALQALSPEALAALLAGLGKA